MKICECNELCQNRQGGGRGDHPRLEYGGTNREHPMGMIADQLRANLDAMKARHAETDREIAVIKRDLDSQLAELIASTDALLKDH